MISNYTETLQQYIDNGGNLHEELFAKLPRIIIVTSDTTAESYDFKQMFIDKYKLREIGAETEQMFEYYLVQKLNEILLEYSSKFLTYKSMIDKLDERSVNLTRSTANKSYLNPMTTDNPKLQDYVTQDENYTQAFGWFKSNPEILRQAMEIKSIYLIALESFNELFMGVY